MYVLRGYPGDEFLQGVFSLQGAKDELAVDEGHLEIHSLLELEILGIGPGNTHREAVAPLADLRLHGKTSDMFLQSISGNGVRGNPGLRRFDQARDAAGLASAIRRAFRWR